MSIDHGRLTMISAREALHAAFRAASRRFAVAGLIVLGSGFAALADPPDRVGRLSYMEGTVSFHAADQDQWSPATLNWPVTSGNSFWTEPNSRAELEIGAAEIRLDQSTEVDVTHFDDNATQFQVAQGIVNVHLRAMPRGGVQVQTPRGVVELIKPGSYRIDAGHPNGDAPADQMQVAVLEGEARIDGPRSVLEVLPGEAATTSGDPVTFSLAEAAPTPFDDWALQRERREQASQSVRYVSPAVPGVQDLDANGRWEASPDYGAVWYPTAVPVGWAPYRYGHWAFVPPWGWTWIDDAPWGFAPFHYGRWVVVGGVWGWVPGIIVAQPVYAPALVAFIGGGGWGVSISVGSAFPAVGWVPLAPHEVFRPYYPASVRYVRNVNITNVNKTVINNITNNYSVTRNVTVTKYINQQGATIVPANAMTRATPVQRAALAVPREQLASAPVTSNLSHLQPSAAARTGIATSAAADLPPAHAAATIAKGPLRASNAPTGGEANAVPKSPGPATGGHPAGRGDNARANAGASGPAIATPAAPRKPSAPTAPAAAPHNAAPSVTAQSQAAPPRGAAPGPRIVRSNTAPAGARPASTAASKRVVTAAPHNVRVSRPVAPVQHPVQQMQLRPTARGWQRQAAPIHPAAPRAPAPPTPQHQAPAQHQNQGDPNLRKPGG